MRFWRRKCKNYKQGIEYYFGYIAKKYVWKEAKWTLRCEELLSFIVGSIWVASCRNGASQEGAGFIQSRFIDPTAEIVREALRFCSGQDVFCEY